MNTCCDVIKLTVAFHLKQKTCSLCESKNLFCITIKKETIFELKKKKKGKIPIISIF